MHIKTTSRLIVTLKFELWKIKILDHLSWSAFIFNPETAPWAYWTNSSRFAWKVEIKGRDKRREQLDHINSNKSSCNIFVKCKQQQCFYVKCTILLSRKVRQYFSITVNPIFKSNPDRNATKNLSLKKVVNFSLPCWKKLTT